MAFANAQVGMFVGVGGGGLITVSDADATTPASTVAANAYWDTAAGLTDGENKRRHDALLDFIELQQAGVGSSAGGVPMLIVTGNGTQATEPYRARVAVVSGARRVRVD